MYSRIIAGLLLLVLSQPSFTETLFSDNFEGGLGQWDDTYNGLNAQIVNDPLVPGNQVLNFTALRGGGDLFSTAALQGQTGGNYILEFDYLGTCGTSNCGGFVGISTAGGPPGLHTWLGGTSSPPPYPDLLPDDGTWHHVTISFNTDYSSFHLMLEEWSGTQGNAGDAYFDNIVLTDANGPTPVPTAVPIPFWTWLLLIGLLGFVGMQMRSDKKSF